MTIKERCVSAQLDHEARRTEQTERTRKYWFAHAIRAGVSYRRLAETVGLNVSRIWDLLRNEDTARPDPFEQDASEAVLHLPRSKGT